MFGRSGRKGLGVVGLRAPGRLLMNQVPLDKSEFTTRSFKSRVVGAGSWTLLGHSLALILRLIGTLVLSRIFYPEVFGILAVISAVQIIITLLTDIGLRQAVVQSRNGANREFLNTAWTVQTLRGLAIWGVGGCFAAGLALADHLRLLPPNSVYSHPGLPAYIAVASSSATILGFQSMKWITASRDLNLKRLIAIDLTVQFFTMAFSIGLGWLTGSIWSYIFGLIFSSASIVLLSHTFLPGPVDRFCWDRAALRELLRFGRWTFMSSALSAFAVNGDRILLGGWVNASILGYYSIASNLASVAEGSANQLFGSVAFPALSEAARVSPSRLTDVCNRMRWFTDTALLFMAGFLFATGALIIKILYDQRYAEAGWMLEYLSFGLVFVRYGLFQSAFFALGRPEYVTVLNVTKLVSLFTFVPILYYSFGLSGAVIGFAIHMLPTTLWIFYFNAKHELNNPRIEIAALGAWVAGWLGGLAIVKLAAACC